MEQDRNYSTFDVLGCDEALKSESLCRCPLGIKKCKIEFLFGQDLSNGYKKYTYKINRFVDVNILSECSEQKKAEVLHIIKTFKHPESLSIEESLSQFGKLPTFANVLYNFSLTSDNLYKIEHVTISFNQLESTPTAQFHNLPWFDEYNPLVVALICYHDIQLHVYSIDDLDFANINLFAETEVISKPLEKKLISKYSLTLNDGTNVI